MSELTKMKWPQCFFKKRNRVIKKADNDKGASNDSEDDIDAFDEKQLDDILYKFSEEIFYEEGYKEKLLKMDVNQKRILIKSSRQKFRSSFDLLEAMLDRLRKLSQEAEDGDQETDKLFDQLSAALRTESLRYVRHFVEADGLGFIFTYMRDCAVHSLNSQVFSQCIRCIRSLGNSENGYEYLLAFKSADECDENHFGLLEVIGKGLWSKNGVTVSMICELFGALCFTEDGWHRVMKALLFLSRNDVHHRFDILVQQFLFQDNFDVKCAVLSLINAIAEFVQDNQDPLTNRVHLRYQTVKCGLTTFIAPFTDCSHSALRKQIEVFVQHQKEDVDLLTKNGRLSITNDVFAETIDNWEDLVRLINSIRSSLACTDAQMQLTSLLHHALLLPLKEDSGFLYLQLIDTMVQQISIQTSNSQHPDPGLPDLQINIDQLLTRLATDNELRCKQMEVDHLIVEHKSLGSKVLELENRCFSLESDKNEIREMYASSAAQLDSCAAKCDKVTSENLTLQNEISHLRLQLNRPQSSGVSSLYNGDTVVPTVVVQPPIRAPMPPAPPPPPLPLTSSTMHSGTPLPAPPPPPPPQTPKHTVITKSQPQKPIPKVTSLKCLNWSKVPQAKLQNSVWNNINEDHIYNILDLETLQLQFSTVVVDTASKTQSTPTMSHKSLIITTHQPSVLSNQRSQNLIIKLKPARMTWPKWQKCIFDCRINSVEDSFPHQLAEGLLTLYPTSEEMELIEEAVSSHGIDQLPEAESFMFECFKFPHYLERLSSLIFLCKAPEHLRRLSSELTNVQTTVNSVIKCPLIPKLFEIVLAVGNVMNQKRGVAYGFKVESLNQLKRLKCSQHGSDGVNNLLEFVIMMVEKYNPMLLDLPKKLECVQSMSKVNVSNIVKDINELSGDLTKLSNTMDLVRRSSREPSEEDRFLDISNNMYSSISKDLNNLIELHKSVKVDIEMCHQFFGENSPASSTSSDSEDSTQKLFAEFALFLSDMNLIWRNILSERERKVAVEQRKSVLRVTSIKPVIGARKGELDVNISRLLSGDAFKENRLFMSRQNQQQSLDVESS